MTGAMYGPEDYSRLHNTDLERHLIGAVFVRPEHIDAIRDEVGFRPEHFHLPEHATIYRTQVRLYDNGGGNPSAAVSLVSVKDALRRSGDLDRVGGPAYLASTADGMPASANVVDWAGRLRDYAERWRAQRIGSQLQAAIAQPTTDLRVEVDRTIGQLLDVFEGTIRDDYVTGEPLIAELDDELNRLAARAANGITGTPTGFHELDAMTTGLQPADLVYVAGRPSMGKTSFALNICEHLLLSTDGAVSIFSLEMQRRQVLLRLLSSVSGIPLQRFRNGSAANASGAEAVAIARARERLRECSSRLAVDQESRIDPMSIRGKLRRQVRSGLPLSLVVVDYIGLMRSSDAHYQSKVYELGGISSDLKALAKEFAVPFLVISQVSRPAKGQETTEPRMSDLRDSGCLEQDADHIWFPWREYQASDGKSGDPTRGVVIIAKQRNGDTGTIEVGWDGPCMRYSNLLPSYVGVSR